MTKSQESDLVDIIDCSPYDVVTTGGMVFTLQEYSPTHSWGVEVIWHKHEQDQDQYMLSFGRKVQIVSKGLDSDNEKIQKRIKKLTKQDLYVDYKTLINKLKETQNGTTNT